MIPFQAIKRFVAIGLAAGTAAVGVSTHAAGLRATQALAAIPPEAVRPDASAQAPGENSATLARRTHELLPSPVAVPDHVQPEANGGMSAQSENLVSAGLTIVPTFDTSITSDPNAAAIEGTINTAIAILQSQFSDPITVNIKFVKGTSGLGHSSTWFMPVSYATFLAALKGDAKTADDATAMSLLPSVATNPVTGQTTIDVKVANLRAVGIATPATPDGFDGTITVNTTTTIPGSPGSTLTYSLQAVVLHEIDEVLGLGSHLPDTTAIFPEDLYRYSSPNTRTFTIAANHVFAYFSIDATHFWAQFDNQNDGGDFGDWQSNPLPTGVSPKVQDAFATPGANPLPSVELVALDVIGYDRVATPLTAPVVVANPANAVVAAGQVATFTAAASGVPTPTVQWQVSSAGGFANISGAISTTYSFTTTLADSGKLFRAIFTNALGSATSASASLIVSGALPTMTLDRTSLIFSAVNNGATFTAVTAGQTVRMTQNGAGSVSWTASSNSPWLQVSPTSGSGSATFTVTSVFSPNLTATQVGSITITLTGAGNTAGPITVRLNSIAPSSVQPPFGSFDTPTNGVTGVAGSIAVTGWALDKVQVTRVTVCRDAASGEAAPIDPNCAGNAMIYIGDAIFVDGARPDVQGLNPLLPLSSRAGWGYLMLTNFLPNLGNGTFTLHAYAFNAEGLTTALGVKTITCANSSSSAPFGAIDQPGQGAVVSGSAYSNFGWVLAPKPNFADPPDGGTVTVFVDGTAVGSPAGWTSRSDLTTLFPATQYPGVSKALAVFGLNSTILTNGVHTIFWVVTGTGGSGTSGIGSRFFTVSNGSGGAAQSAAPASAQAATVIAARATVEIPPAASARVSGQTLASEVAAAPTDLSAVQGRRGFDLELPLRTYTSSSGAIDVQAEELDRIELQLSSGRHHLYSGYLQTAGGLRPLPVGSSLDASTGTFTWMPGVGFYGTYNLTFVRWSGGTAVARQDVRITLNAKGSNRVGPQTVIDAPSSGGVGSPFFVGGWAADLDSAVDSGINTVHVWAYPVDASGTHLEPIFIGPAFYGGARPDVGAVYGDRFTQSGYGIIVNGLAPGTYDIAVFAYSTVVNNFTPARVVRVTVR